ncbi:hypothetical protein HKD37_12G034246 [Glycine soja]
MAPKKLSAKRSRRDTAAKGTSAAPEFDSHRISSALRPSKDGRSTERDASNSGTMNALSQFLGDPLVLEEGQECEFSQRRNRADGFDEEAIAQLICTSGQDFAQTAAGRQVRIMRTSMTTLTQMWMTLLLSNVLPSDHNSDLPLPKCMSPTRHPLDPHKSNRALGFPALIMASASHSGFPSHLAQGDAPQAVDAPPPPYQANPAGSLGMERLSQQGQGFVPFACPTPDQFRVEVVWPGDWLEALAGEVPAEAPDDAEEARMDEEMTDLLGFLGGRGAT